MTYSTWRNMQYLLKNLWIWDKNIVIALCTQAPLAIAVSYFGIWIPKAILDAVTSGVGYRGLLASVGILMVGYVVINTIEQSLGHWVGLKKISHRQRYIYQMAEKAVHTDFENIDGASGQERYSIALMAVSSNGSATEQAVRVFGEILVNSLGLALFGAVILTLHPILIGFVVLSAVINYFGSIMVNRYIASHKEALSETRRKLAYINRTGGEFKAAKDLKLYNVSPWFSSNFKVILKERLNLSFKDDLSKLALHLVDGFLILLREGLTYGILLYGVIAQTITVGEFALYVGAVAGLSKWILGIVTNLGDMNAMSLDVNHLRSYLEMPDHRNCRAGTALPDKGTWPCEIELIDICYRYPGSSKNTIDHLNLHVKKGEKLALVGVNGAGKTTLVKLITGLYTPTSGTIKVNGIPIDAYNSDAYLKLFSVVFQDYYVLPLTIEENVALKMSSELTSEESLKVDQVLALSGLKRKLETMPMGKHSRLVKSVFDDAVEFSGGEYQKLMLAQALYKAGPIMILDEPTAALDPIAENEIYQQYNGLTQAHTSIFISHRLSSTRFCDRIAFLENGKIVEMGSHSDLMMQDSRYKHMFDMQSHYYKEEGAASA